ncbi:glycoside hydrolase [Alistipes sp.]|uniref:glycoside hydrolase n=1 Tax=Alistipes sp. TaxID=1872444 RepID=UPI003A8A30B7
MKRTLTACALLLLAAACSKEEAGDNGNGGTDLSQIAVSKLVTINAAAQYQTIAGFGASDAWSPETVGTLWTAGRDGISEALFSREIVNGQPRGIGLSMWRVNLGGGTAEQGDESGIKDATRRAQSYLNEEGTGYDWTKCAGQRYFLDRAKTFGVEKVVLFSNTPPVQYTLNGKGYSDNGAHANLQADRYDDFADYMADVAQHYLSLGYPVTHISPVNEPQYNWQYSSDGGQEGSGWANAEVARLARELDASLSERNLGVDILLGEAGDFTYLYSQTSGNADRSDVIRNFFSPSSQNYVGDLAHVKKLICGHSYWTDGTWEGMRSVRSNLRQSAEQYGLELWQSEWSMLGDGYSTDEFVGYEAASEMDIALYMAKVIHNDLTVAGVTSWSFWTSMDVPRWGQKCRFMLIALGDGTNEFDIRNGEGAWKAAPTLWVLGNYSLFVRPGYHRIALTLNESRSFFGSAYASPDGKRIVAVYTNLSNKPVKLVETRENFGAEPRSIVKYTTSATSSLRETVLNVDDAVLLDAESVTTVVYDLE